MNPAHWFAQLSEYLPDRWIVMHRSELDDLRTQGTGPRAASLYARAFLLAPSLAGPDCIGLPDYAPPRCHPADSYDGL